MEQILGLDDEEDKKLCLRVLRSVVTAYRPLTLEELAPITELPIELHHDTGFLDEIVELCSSFLTVCQGTTYFVHQSAKDYFITGEGRSIFLSNK